MGDSTFFHSGQIAISHAIKIGQDITFIILDNSTTAMTGHQPTPGVDYDILGNRTPKQDIEEVVRGMAPAGIERADRPGRPGEAQGVPPAAGGDVPRRRREGDHRRQGMRHHAEPPPPARGAQSSFAARASCRSRQHMNVNQEICRFCLACAEQTGCPGLKHVETDYGPKMDTVAVQLRQRRRVRARRGVQQLRADHHPPQAPAQQPHARARPGRHPRAARTRPGRRPVAMLPDGRRRHGHRRGHAGAGPRRAQGRLPGHLPGQEGPGHPQRRRHQPGRLQHLQPARSRRSSPTARRTCCWASTCSKPPAPWTPRAERASPTASGRSRWSTPTRCRPFAASWARRTTTSRELEKLIRANTRAESYLARNISRICEMYLGGKIYANIMMIGFAFQSGQIPVSMHSIAWAIKDTIKSDFRKNLLAFNMGRKLVVAPDLFQGAPRRTGWRETLEEKCRDTIRRHAGRRGRELADDLRAATAGLMTKADALDETLRRDIVVRAYDAMRWGGHGLRQTLPRSRGQGARRGLGRRRLRRDAGCRLQPRQGDAHQGRALHRRAGDQPGQARPRPQEVQRSTRPTATA